MICKVLTALVLCQVVCSTPRWYRYYSSRLYSCKSYNCPADNTCRRGRFISLRPYPRCRPDAQAIVRARLTEYENNWNTQNYDAIEASYVKDTVILPPVGVAIKGRKGFGETLKTFIIDNKWGDIKWTVDSVNELTDDLYISVDFFTLKNREGVPFEGKSLNVWQKEDGIYRFKYQSPNFDEM